tara:strand:- start:1095 stop:1313 length:219 start_codon:yes stop_codon:yes gene_type:complete
MSDELINLVIRQTDYDEEKARERLTHWDNDYISVIKEYLNPNFQQKKEEKKLTNNQRIMKELRDFYDGKIKS